MSININNFAKKAWNIFIKNGMTPQGASSMLGNMYAESGMIPNRVEILCLKRIKEYYGITYTDETYTAAVNSGKISRAQFLNPLPERQYGYSSTQLTSPSRKAGLYDRTVAKGKSIADEDIQIDYIIYELKTLFPSVWNTLTTTTSIKTASDKVLKDFECPDNWSQYSSQRVSYSQEYYNYFSKQSTVTKGSDVVSVTKEKAINAMIATAEAEIGYLEKASNSQLDSKTANAGSNNYTKYWRDVYSGYQAQAWCACFVSWVFMKTFGQDVAKRLLKHWPYVYCPTMASLFALNSNPKKGDIVIFYRNGEFAHTGIVVGVNGDQFTTIEGNTSNGSTIIANGGGVCKKTYYNSNLPGTKFCTPDYSIVTKILTNTSSNTASASTSKTVDSSASLSEVSKWKGKVNKANAPVRTWAGSDYKEVSFSPLKKNTEVEVCDTIQDNKKRDWYYIKFGDKFGFIYGSYITKITTAKKTTKTQYRVQTGAYSVYENARASTFTLQDAGFDAVVIKSGTLNIVQLGMFDSLANANALRDKAKEAGFDAVVIAVKV